MNAYDHSRDPDGRAPLMDLLAGRTAIRREDAGDHVVDPLPAKRIEELRQASDRIREAERQVRRALDHGCTEAQAAAIAACKQALHFLERP